MEGSEMKNGTKEKKDTVLHHALTSFFLCASTELAVLAEFFFFLSVCLCSLLPSSPPN